MSCGVDAIDRSTEHCNSHTAASEATFVRNAIYTISEARNYYDLMSRELARKIKSDFFALFSIVSRTYNCDRFWTPLFAVF